VQVVECSDLGVQSDRLQVDILTIRYPIFADHIVVKHLLGGSLEFLKVFCFDR
jgi:hypothetical protein